MYKVVFTLSAEKELLKLPEKELLRIISKIEELIKDPHPHGSIKLKTKEGLWRLRCGNYRIIYSLINEKMIVEIIRIRHRKDAYSK